MTTLTETFQDGGFIVSEQNKSLSREAITVLSGENLLAGTVLGAVDVGSAAAAADAGNTGDGAMGAVTVGAGASPGVYTLTIVDPATNAGSFTFEDPAGVTVDSGTVAVAFAGGGLSFTLADGATDFVAGDIIRITVAAGTGKYREYDPTNTDGTETAVGILFADVDASAADASGVAIKRLAEVNESELVWFSGASAGQIVTGMAELALLTIIGR